MEVYIIFGLPGVGKTFVGSVFKKYFDYYFYDADSDIPPFMKKALRNQEPITDAMRDVFFTAVTNQLAVLKKKHTKIVLAQTFIKDKYRTMILQKHPEVKFVLVEADWIIRESRLLSRTEYPLDIMYARQMCKLFDLPTVPHFLMNNNVHGEERIQQQIISLLR